MKCEILLVTREPVRLCVDGVSDGSVCECSELGVEEGEWWGHGELKEVWEALGRGESENCEG